MRMHQKKVQTRRADADEMLGELGHHIRKWTLEWTELLESIGANFEAREEKDFASLVMQIENTRKIRNYANAMKKWKAARQNRGHYYTHPRPIPQEHTPLSTQSYKMLLPQNRSQQCLGQQRVVSQALLARGGEQWQGKIWKLKRRHGEKTKRSPKGERRPESLDQGQATPCREAGKAGN
jgi:hypothetical protein